jgi:antitoxin component YwqK of YwqJK toxin-antitoxin module
MVSYSSVPSSSFSAGRAVGARELTAREEQLFERRRKQGLAALVLLIVAVISCGYLLAHLTTQQHVDVRTKFYGSGVPQITAEYVDGKKHGAYVEFYQNGKKKAEGRYYREVEDGIWTTYFYNGAIETRGARARGLRHGPFEKFYPSGEKKAVEAYDDGVAHGRWVSWHENGQIESEQHFVKGLAHGRERHWYADGTLASEGQFENGFAEGLFTAQDEKGRMLSRGAYTRGHRDGEWDMYSYSPGCFECEPEGTEYHEIMAWKDGDLVETYRPGRGRVDLLRAR